MTLVLRHIYAALVLSAVLGAVCRLHAEEPETRRLWKFQSKEGVVEIELTRVVGKDGRKPTSLHIYSSNGAPRYVSEEAKFLSAVLDDLPKDGIDVQSLDWISFQFNEPDAISKVAVSAALSKQWRDALKSRKTPTIYALVTSFLNNSGAYNEWDAVFRKHGLTLRAVEVEEVIMERFSKTGAKCPAGANCTNLPVPIDALVQINVIPAAHP